MDLLREKLKSISAARLHGGGGGGGGGDSDGVSPSAGPGAGPGAPGTGPASNSDTGIGDVATGSNGTPGIGMGTPMGMGLGIFGQAIGMPMGMLNGVATVGNAINNATGFAGGTPSADTSSPGGFMTPTGWVPSATFGGGEQQLDYDPRVASIMGVDYARRVFQGGAGAPFNPFGMPTPGAPAAPAAAATPASVATPAATAPAPGGTAEEQAFRQAQLDLVNQQRSIATEMLRRQNLLEGEQMRQQGMEQVLDAQGNVTGYRPTADAQRQLDSTNEINNLMRTRTLAALKGELPVDPALERSIGENRATLENTLRGNLGTGYATSTPGMQSLSDFDKRAEELRMQQRRDQLSTGEGIRLAGEDLNNRVSSSRFGNIVGLSGLPQGGASILGTASSGLTPGLQNLLGNSGLTLQDLISGRTNDTSRYLGGLDADTRRAIAALTGAVTTNGQNMQANAQGGAGLGSILGTLGSAFISHPDSFGSLMSGIGGLFGGGGGGDALGAFGSSLGIW